MNTLLRKYGQLLVNYCVDLQEGEKLFVQTSTLAEPLVREVYRAALEAGGHVEVEMEFREQNRIFYQNAGTKQLEQVPLLYQHAMKHFDAYIHIRAPYNLFENRQSDPKKVAIHKDALAPVRKIYFERTGDRRLKRNLCQYPTQAAAQNAGLSLEEYQNFIFSACHLDKEDPIQAWLDVRHNQQVIVDHLNSCTDIKYQGPGIDISFSTQGRTWINSDGQTNMPSGEVYTSPVEDSVNGHITFDHPAVYMGHEVEGVTLWVEGGEVVKWEARRGQDFLNRIFQIKGAKRFGEAAIGTNYNINRFTRNILFDEKIGGTVHMAIGQSYLQAGGKNESSIHWDMIAGMKNGGCILADGEKIYENGYFLLPELENSPLSSAKIQEVNA